MAHETDDEGTAGQDRTEPLSTRELLDPPSGIALLGEHLARGGLRRGQMGILASRTAREATMLGLNPLVMIGDVHQGQGRPRIERDYQRLIEAMRHEPVVTIGIGSDQFAPLTDAEITQLREQAVQQILAREHPKNPYSRPPQRKRNPKRRRRR